MSAWRGDSLPIDELGAWDGTEDRIARYWLYGLYYNNVAYDQLLLAQSRNVTDTTKLYKNIRSIYNPTYRLVQAYQAKVMGGVLDIENLTTGAMRIVGADDRLQDAVRQTWKWSNWQTEKGLFIRNGVLYGDSFIKVVDDRTRGKVRLEVLAPQKVADIEVDESGNIKKITIEYEINLGTKGNPNTGTYREEITKESFKTFFKDKPYAFIKVNGEPVSEWANPYGFVPVVHCKHENTGLLFGANGWHSQRGKIDEINEQATLLNANVRKVVHPLLAVTGATAGDIKKAGDSKIPIISVPTSDARIAPLVANINIADASQNIQYLLEELERDLPELALHRVRESNMSGVAIRNAYGDAIERFQHAHANYAGVYTRAQQMAITMGGLGRYQGFSGYHLGSYAAGDLEFHVAAPELFADELTVQERIAFLVQTGAPQASVWRELGIGDEMIDSWQDELAQEEDALEVRVTREVSRLAAQNGAN